MQSMFPEDVVPVFRDAAFGVASKNYLTAITKRFKLTQEFKLTISEKDEVQHIITLRQARGLPDYRFDQDFVMSLLSATASEASVHYSTAINTLSSHSEPASPLYETVSVSTPEITSSLVTSISLQTTSSPGHCGIWSCQRACTVTNEEKVNGVLYH